MCMLDQLIASIETILIVWKLFICSCLYKRQLFVKASYPETLMKKIYANWR